MENINYKKEFILWIFLIVPLIYIGYVWDQLPATIPIHFDLQGTPNGWGGKWAVFIGPVVNIAVYLLIFFLPQIDPKRMNYSVSGSAFLKMRWVIVIFLSIVTVIATRAAITGSIAGNISRWIPAGVFLLLAILGNFMINIKPNWFIGIRTPWTLSSDTVWRETHRLTGKIWFYGGLICAGLTIYSHDKWVTGLIIAFAVGSTIFAFGYSFWLFREEKKGKPNEG